MKKATMIIIAIVLFALPAAGQEMRKLTPIRSKAAVIRNLPPGAKLVEPAQPLPAGTLSRSTEAIAGAWNSPDLKNLLSDKFYDKSRLGDAMNSEVPRDATIKVINSRNAGILSQAIVPDPKGGRLRVSTVTVVLETRAEFNDPRHGFISAPGTNEMIMEVIEKID